ncbi:MAG: lipopolysaccharide biosynthesis protein [Candidatus Omnitrophota bacterium]
MNIKRAISRDFFSYAASFLMVQGINVLIAVFLRRVLGPAQMGVWVVLQIILSYSKFTSFGIGRVITRDIPVYKGKGDLLYAAKLRNVSFSFTVFSSSAVAVVILITAFFLKGSVSSTVFYSSLTLALLSVLQRVINFSIGVLRAEKEFEFTAAYNLASTLVNALLTVLLVWYFRLGGYYVALILSFIFNAFFIFARARVRFRFQWDRAELGRILRDGLIFVLINFLASNLMEIDRISVSLFLGVTPLGIYSIVNMVNNIIYAVPSIFNIVVWPYLNEAYGADNSSENIRKYLTLPPRVLALYVPILIGFLWMLAPYLIRTFLPQYVAGILPMKIGMFTILLELLLGLAGQAIITYQKHWALIPILLGTQLSILGLNFLAVQAGGGLVSISLLTLAGTFIGYAFYSDLSLRNVIPSPWGRRKELLKISALLGYYMGSMLLIDRVTARMDMSLDLFLKPALFCIVAYPLFHYGESRFHLLKLVKLYLQNKAGKK